MIRSVRTRIALGVAAVAALGVLVVGLVAPGLVRTTLEDDLLESEAVDIDASLEFVYDDALLTELGLDTGVDPAELTEVVAPELLDDGFVPTGGDAYLASQLVLLQRTGRLADLTAIAGDPIVLALDEQLAVLVTDGRITALLDGLDPSDSIAGSTTVDGDDRPAGDAVVLASDELDEYLFDDLGLVPLGDGRFVEVGGADRVLVDVVDVGGTRYLVTAGADAIDESVDGTRRLLWLVLPVAVLALTALAWILATRALRPVAAITGRAATITANDLDARVPVPDSGDEIAELATTVNEMIDRIDAEDRRRRRFVSDASHELRTPVAVIRNEAEVALQHPDQVDAGALAATVADEARRLTDIVDDLLALARHDEGRTPPSTDVDLDDLVLAEAVRTRRVPVTTADLGAGRVTGSPDDLARMVCHLLDNAARHAASQVAVGLRTVDDTVVLTVDDDGPGVPAEHREAIFERFTRLDDARTRDRGGAGLGLAVVAEIARRGGGTAEVTDADLGGARFVVRLPAS